MPGESSLSISDQEQQRLRKALRESEILRELAALLASSLDLTHILQVLVTRTTEVCDIERCTVWLVEEGENQLLLSNYFLSAQHLNPTAVKQAEAFWRQGGQGSRIPVDDPIIQSLAQNNGILSVAQLHSEPTMRVIAEKFFVRSVLFVALLREERLVGVLSLDDPGKARTFSHEQQQLACSIGQQAAIAIGNAQLYQQAQKERKRAELLIERVQSIHQVANAVNSGEDLATVLELALHHLINGLSADGGAIALLQDDRLSIASIKPTNSPSRGALIKPRLADLPHCYATATYGTPSFMRAEQAEGSEKQWYEQLGFHHVMLVPLLLGTHKTQAQDIGTTRQTQCIGFAIINYHSSAHHLTKGHYAFAQDVAAQCALAIEKERIIAETRRSAILATENANTLNAVFNAMTEGILVLDLNGQIVISNNAASQFLGIPLHAKSQLSAFFKRYPAYTMNGQRMAEKDFPLTRALKGELIRGERFVGRRTDGSERTLEVSVAPLLDSDKNKIGLVSAFRDITEQVRVDRRIRQALDTMLHAVEAVSGLRDVKSILRTVLAMTVTTLNCDHGLALLYDQEQQSFLPLLSIGLPIEVEKEWLASQQEFLEHKEHYETFRLELLTNHAALMRADQCPLLPDLFDHSMVLAAPIIRNHALLGVMIFHRNPGLLTETVPQSVASTGYHRRDFTVWDMTIAESVAQFAGMALEEARWKQEATTARTSEAAMRESNELKDQFLDITAHEFRTPLTVILAHAQMIARALKRTGELALRDKIYENVTIIEEQTHQLTNIVNTFLEVARLNSGKIELKMEEVDLAEIAQHSVLAQSATTTEHAIHYTIAPDNAPYLVRGDAPRLLQIFTNLLQNAIKYSPFGGSITVSLRHCTTSKGEAVVEVRIQDQGMGIPLEAQSRLFERFYRVSSVEGSKTKGLGLGLYIVAELLRRHNGTIRVESSGVLGEGSCFIFTLPTLERDSNASD